MGLKLAATSGGSVELVPTNTASNFTATMPAGTGTVSVIGVNSAITSGTAVASTSGTSIDFTSIPSWVKRITVMFNVVSTNGTSPIQVQLGAGSVDTASYNGQISSGQGNNTNYTTGFYVVQSTGASASGTYYGQLVISLLGSNLWVASGLIGHNIAAAGFITSGVKTLSGALDRVRITTVNGTDTFDAGSINILYE